MIKKFVSVLLILALVVTTISSSLASAIAVGSIWDGSIATGFDLGTGSEDDPYIIKTPEQLAFLAESVNQGNTYYGKFIRLDADVLLNDITDWQLWGTYDGQNNLITPTNSWTPIGDQSSWNNFNGVFDGNGHSVSGLYINNDSYNGYTGLFSYIESSGLIKNLGIENSYITTDNNTYVGGIAAYTDNIIENCYSNITINSDSSSVGGVVGEGKAVNCYNLGAVKGNSSTGGVVGDGSAIDCYNIGEVSGSSSIGGVVGTGFATRCYNKGKVSAENYNVGGIVGNSESNTVIDSCYNAGEVHGNSEVGGIVGDILFNSTVITNCYNTGTIHANGSVGGIVGRAEDKKVKFCYNAGEIITPESEYKYNINGIVGDLWDDGVSENCYYLNTSVTPTDNNQGEISLTAEQMALQSSFVNYNFTNVWEIGYDTEYAYPTLRCFGSKEYFYEYKFTDEGSELGSDITLFGNQYTFKSYGSKPGYRFKHWLDEQGNCYKIGDVITVEGNKTFTAIWYKSNIQAGVWDGSVANGFDSGNGTKGDPYIIKTPSQLAFLSKSVNEGNTYREKYFRLDADIKLNDSTAVFSDIIAGQNEWSPIGGQYRVISSIVDYDSFEQVKNQFSLFVKNENGFESVWEYNPIYNTYYSRSEFYGVFDGNNHKIGGVYINSKNEYQGLFGRAEDYESEIKNLGIENSYIKGTDYVGGIVGYKYGDKDSIINCYNNATVIGINNVGGIVGCGDVTGSYNSGNIKGEKYVGGISGEKDVIDSYNTGTVVGTENVGGIVGQGNVDYCYNTGKITGQIAVGGIVGYWGTVSNSYNTGAVSGKNDVGGIAGDWSTAENCYNTGAISGENYVGGVTSDSTATNCYNTGLVTGIDCVGGISGSGETFNCYNIGNVVGEGNVGGVTGVYSNGSVNGYYLDTSVEYEGEIFGTALTSAQMENQDNYKGFNFNNVWEMGVKSGYSYPTLRSLGSKIFYYEFKFTDGEKIIENDLHLKDKVYTFKAPAAKAGYAFSYWRDDDYNKYAAGDTLSVNNDIEFSAVWHKINVQSDVWDGTVAESFESGDGSENNPYIIKTPAQLAYFAKTVNNYERYTDEFIRLDADIKLNDTDAIFDDTLAGQNEWTPIGHSNNFSGTFLGNNHSISGVYINSKEFDVFGLFGNIREGEIRDLTLEHSYIKSGYYETSDDYVGGVVGDASYSIIKNVHNKATVITSANDNVGGVIGYSNETVIDSCINSGDVSSIYKSYNNNYVGGIAGYNGGIVTNSKNYGKITGMGHTGGIVGRSSGEINNCHNFENISSSGSYVGGIAGDINNKLADCSNSGDVTAKGYSYVGGIVGGFNYSNIEFANCINSGNVLGSAGVGGIIGEIGGNHIEFKNNSNSGTIFGSHLIGGLIGDAYNDYSNYTNCYNTGAIYGSYRDIGGIIGETSGYNNMVSNCFNVGNIQRDSEGFLEEVGGIVGENSGSGFTVMNCYNTGDLIGTKAIGGIVGEADGATVSSCYNIGKVTSKYSEAGGIVGGRNNTATDSYYIAGGVTAEEYINTYGTALTEDAMKLQDSFTGFDFAEVWTIDAQGEYPYPTLTGNVHRITYVVTFKDSDGSVISTQSVIKGENAKQPDMTDSTYSDNEYVYSFDKWDAKFNNVISDLTVTAMYTKTAIIKFLGKEFDLGEVPMGYSAENLKVDLESYYSDVLLVTTNGYTMASKTCFDMSGYNPALSGEQTIILTPILTDSLYYAMADGAALKVKVTVLSNGEDVLENQNSDFAYIENGDTVTITGYNGTATDVVVPDKLADKKVVAIGNAAFKEKNIRTVFIPASVKSVGNEAFLGCNQLITVIFSNGIETIGDKAFLGCDLASVTLPNTVTSVNEKAFGYDAELRKIEGFAVYGYTAAENYATANGFDFSVISVQDDAELGVTAVVESGYTLSASQVTEGLYFDTAADLSVNPSQVAVYNININSGSEEELQPNNVMRITIKIPSGADPEVLRVYRINSDGSVKDMNAVVEGENLVFYVSHLSYYAVVPTKVPYMPGDINGDGSVTLSDVSLLAQYVAKWQGLELIEEALDVNGDGEITLSDVSHLAQYVAKWEGIVLH